MTSKEVDEQPPVVESLIPDEPKEIILSFLEEWADKQRIVGVRIGPYNLKPTIKQEVDTVLGSYVQWLMEKDAGHLSPEDFLLDLEELANDALDTSKHDTVHNLTSQLYDLNEIMGLVNTQQTKEAIRMFATTNDSFAKRYKIYLGNPHSVLSSNSFVQHPWAQAMTIDLMTKLYLNLNTPELQQIKLALCWHLLPDDQTYKIRALTECLDSFATFKSRSSEEQEQKEAFGIWQAAIELAESIDDPIAERLRTEHRLPSLS